MCRRCCVSVRLGLQFDLGPGVCPKKWCGLGSARVGKLSAATSSSNNGSNRAQNPFWLWSNFLVGKLVSNRIILCSHFHTARIMSWWTVLWSASRIAGNYTLYRIARKDPNFSFAFDSLPEKSETSSKLHNSPSTRQFQEWSTKDPKNWNHQSEGYGVQYLQPELCLTSSMATHRRSFFCAFYNFISGMCVCRSVFLCSCVWYTLKESFPM